MLDSIYRETLRRNAILSYCNVKSGVRPEESFKIVAK
jgi:hypothetical protein